MAGVQDHVLALAVARAGGLGAIPAAMLSPAALGAELAAFRAASTAPLNVNFFCHTPPAPDATAQARWLAALQPRFQAWGVDPATIDNGPGRLPFADDTADLLAEYRPEVVSFHFGLPAPHLLAKVRAWGAKVIASATTVDEALWLQDHGADAIIAQGLEAGGHRGHFLDHDLSRQAGLFALLPQVARAVSLPVIAAGGICTPQAVTAAQALGAQAVQVGTAYLLSPEATTRPVHRAALKSESSRHTTLTRLMTGRPARAMWNQLMHDMGPMADVQPPPFHWPPPPWLPFERQPRRRVGAIFRRCGLVKAHHNVRPCQPMTSPANSRQVGCRPRLGRPRTGKPKARRAHPTPRC
jgi:nitronate monooxygenase